MTNEEAMRAIGRAPVKNPEPSNDPALDFPPPDDEPVEKPAKERKPRKPSAPRAKSAKNAKSEKVGWFIETYPLVDKDGKSVADLSGMVAWGPVQATNLTGVMKSFKALAEKSPEAVNHHSIRIVKVEKVFSTKTRQVVEVVE